MPTEQIHELEARLEATLRNIEDIDIEIEKHAVGSREAVSLRQLQQAYLDLALALKRSIACKMREPARCELALAERESHEAATEFGLSENELRYFGEGSFTQRWDHREAARKRWEGALHKLCRCRSAYLASLASDLR